MTRSPLPYIALVALLVAGCTGGGRNYWLYPEPRLAPEEEALFVAYESHRLVSIDGEDTASRCWGQTVNEPQAYRRNDLVCRLHLQPGRHTAVVEGRFTLRGRSSVDFTAEPGKVYGLVWSDCTTPVGGYQ
ncbi:MAG: hypothetical protein HKO65_01200, partial [Gemmatimonadetes bacterium]|nr:hypothetical protein [Gemmatimonadota bacterium]